MNKEERRKLIVFLATAQYGHLGDFFAAISKKRRPTADEMEKILEEALEMAKSKTKDDYAVTTLERALLGFKAFLSYASSSRTEASGFSIAVKETEKEIIRLIQIFIKADIYGKKLDPLIDARDFLRDMAQLFIYIREE